MAAYRDSFRLFLTWAHRRLRKPPSAIMLEDIDAPLVTAFLEHLERDRGNSARTRNARLAAIHSFFQYAALRSPAEGASIQRVLAIPTKRIDRAVVDFLRLRRWTHCSQHLIRARGSADEITRFSSLLCRPDFGPPS